MKRISLLMTLLAFVVAANGQINFVNPFVGTAEHGHTYPGALVPFGGVQLSPDTRLDGWDGCSAYHYSDTVIHGFSHTHLSGTGVSDYGDILVMPGGEPASFSHEGELASPGYYKVTLNNGIKAELTATQRVGVHRYTFPKGKDDHCILIDLQHRDKVLASALRYKDGMMQGYRRSDAWNTDQYCAFALTSSQKIKKVVFYKDGQEVSNVDEVDGTDCKAMICYPASVSEVVLTVAISEVSEESAIDNLQDVQAYNFDFDAVRNDAAKAWNEVLGKIEITTSDKEVARNFYTALYHAYTAPYLYTDNKGRYRGMDGQIHQVARGRQIYTVFSLWDTYRALHPLLNLIDRKHTADFLYTFLQQYREGGALPVWELSAAETNCMIGYHSIPVIYDAFVKEISDYDTQEMLQAMVASAKMDHRGRVEMATYGYIPGDMDAESVSKTLEYAYDDWCIAQYAKHLGENAIYEEFMQRAQSYKNLMDENGFMHGKVNGGFTEPFAPGEVNNYYTEANSWQYSTYVPHDFGGLVEMLGGREAALRFLDSLFFSETKMSGRNQADITGIIGQYAHGNEPSHHAAYLYNYLGQPEKTQELVYKIMTELYTSQPDGLCGNEDCGQMSAWYVFSAMGFYPVCPGSNQYIIGYPLVEQAKLHLENGRLFTIKRSGNGKHILGATLNGQPFNRSFITYEEIAEGGTLVFYMGNEMTDWGKGAGNEPVTGEFEKIMPVPYFSTCEKTFAGSMDVEIKLPKMATSGSSIYYTLDGSEPTAESGKLYTKPLVISKNTTLKAIAVNPTLGTSKIAEAKYIKFNQDKEITYLTRPQPQYFDGGEDGLIDNLRAGSDFHLGGWQGFLHNGEFILDLQSSQRIKEIGVGALYDQRSWILYPREIKVWVSEDGENYTLFGSKQLGEAKQMKNAEKTDFTVEGSAKARYVKVIVVNAGFLPSWHKGAGERAWLFLDEIWVK